VAIQLMMWQNSYDDDVADVVVSSATAVSSATVAMVGLNREGINGNGNSNGSGNVLKGSSRQWDVDDEDANG